MSAKILAFDPSRRIPARHYTPIAMRGRLLEMPARTFGPESKVEGSALPMAGNTDLGPSIAQSPGDSSRVWAITIAIGSPTARR